MVEKGEYRLDVLWEIDFDALEDPRWRTSQEGLLCEQGDVKKTVKEMISDVMKFHKRWEQEKKKYDQKMVKEMEMEDSAESLKAMYSPSLHHFQHRSTMYGPNPTRMTTSKHWWMPGRVRQDIHVL
ncbi:hypothetical protein P5673_003254 [Acropora cervicornis]|uniref:Uncharacterized protein n=1 Tax=Acropora cervicornis TaxID=6130 RepID=A0AAD9VEQ3_ACRCE|nr:hypothetical protein P5673_003254 [Acropora cervicornis]